MVKAQRGTPTPKADKMRLRLNLGRSLKILGGIVITCIVISQLLSFYSYKNRAALKDEDFFDKEAFHYFEGDGVSEEHTETDNKPVVPQQNNSDAGALLKTTKPTMSKAFDESMKDHETIIEKGGRHTDSDIKKKDTVTATWNMHKKKVPTNSKSSCANISYTSFQMESYCLKNDTRVYFKVGSKGPCLLEGTKFVPEGQYCICNPGWYGQGCSVPSSVKESNYPTEYGVRINETPRRIIYGFPFSHEFDILQARVHELGDTVDLYIIVESNYSASGTPKERMLYQRLQQGFLKDFQHKIFYVFLEYFPQEAYEDGWVIDGLVRDVIARGLTQIHNLRDDDIFLLTDADELPKRETLLYLKVNYGYPQPIGFVLRHTYFGFYWSSPDHETSHAYGACTIAMLREVFDWRPYLVRSATNNMNARSQLDEFKHHHNGRISPWNFGSAEQPSGWHCSWCFTPEGVKYKMLAAHISDRPRWGNFPDKVKLPYIREVISNGTWFDGKTHFLVSHRLTPLYAPQYMKDHSEKFSQLLELPDYGSHKVDVV